MSSASLCSQSKPAAGAPTAWLGWQLLLQSAAELLARRLSAGWFGAVLSSAGPVHAAVCGHRVGDALWCAQRGLETLSILAVLVGAQCNVSEHGQGEPGALEWQKCALVGGKSRNFVCACCPNLPNLCGNGVHLQQKPGHPTLTVQGAPAGLQGDENQNQAVGDGLVVPGQRGSELK